MQFVITIILARLLSPNDFGLVAMATVFLNFVAIFGEFGISSALIQKQDAQDRHYYSAFWLNIVVGAVLTIAFFLMAPLIAWFYKKPELKLILMVISINFFISAFVIIQQALLMKEMDFKKLAIRDIIAVLLSGLVGIILAYGGMGVWSLIYQLLTFTIFNAILLWVLSPWRPKFMFSMEAIKEIFHFSANLTGFSVLNYLSSNLDKLIIGKLLGAEILGYYTLAYKIMIYPLQNISGVIGKVMLPAFSRINTEFERIKTAYLKMLRAISLITFPLMLGLFAVANEFVTIVCGKQWQPVVDIIRIFCFCGLFKSIGTTVGTIYLSKGRADLQFKLEFLNIAVIFLAIILGVRWGIIGVTLFLTVQSIFWVCLNLYFVVRLIHLKASSLFFELIKPFVISLILCFSMIIAGRIIIISNLRSLMIFAVLCGFGYIFMLWISKELSIEKNKIKFGFMQ